jgi:hypothetical protein
MSLDAVTRRERLNDLCVQRGWISQKSPGIGSASELVKRVGRSSSFWSSRLAGQNPRPIGEEVAREIEQKLDLPRYYLDDAAGWPFSRTLQVAIEKLDEADRVRAENMLRGFVGLPSIEASLGEMLSDSEDDRRSGTLG